VLAQDGPDRASDNDRLKAVERKIDKLLEVMGGSSRRNAPPDAPPSPDSIPRGAVPAPPPTPELAPLAPPSPVTAAPPVAPSVDIAAVPRWGRSAHPVPEPSLKNMAGRVELLERRLSELERRFGDLERRVGLSHATPGLPAGPALVPSARATGAPLRPDGASLTSGASYAPAAVAPDLIGGLPSADTAPSNPASEGSSFPRPSSPSP
jgi:hypothetical protein